MLQELEDTQIEDFLARWHRGAYDEARQGETKRKLLARAIADSAAIRQLAGNPLLLTMMAILNRTQDLPRDRTELYEQCARLLLHQWKVELALALDPELAKACSISKTNVTSSCALPVPCRLASAASPAI